MQDHAENDLECVGLPSLWHYNDKVMSQKFCLMAENQQRH